MTEVLVRALRPDDPADTSAFAAVRRVCVPAMLATSASVAFDAAHAHPDAHYLQLVAEVDGEVVGTAQTGVAYDSPEPGQSFANVYVHPGRRGAGAGSLLVRTAEEYLAGKGATTVYSWVLDSEENRAAMQAVKDMLADLNDLLAAGVVQLVEREPLRPQRLLVCLALVGDGRQRVADDLDLDGSEAHGSLLAMRAPAPIIWSPTRT